MITLLAVLATIVSALCVYNYLSLRKTRIGEERSLDNEEVSVSATVQENLDIKNDPRYSSPHIIPYSQIVTVKDEYNSVEKVITLPLVRNVSNADISDSINSLFTFKKVTDSEFSDLKESTGGVTDVDYVIHYDKNNILSIDVWTEFMGAYPSTYLDNYVISIATGNLIKPEDIFLKNGISKLTDLLNAKLQKNISDSKKEAAEGGCSEEDLQWGMDQKEFNSTYGTFTEKDLEKFSITEEGVTFRYDFEFPHAILACAPDGLFEMSFTQLKPYLDPKGLLAREIK